MSSPIYLSADDISFSKIKSAIKDLEKASRLLYQAYSAATDGGLFELYDEANGFVFTNSSSSLYNAKKQLSVKITQLEQYSSLLSSGTERIEDADSSFKNALEDHTFWDYLRPITGVNTVLVTYAWLTTLFSPKDSKSTSITYQHVIDEFDWSRTDVTEKELNELIENERELAELKGERLTEDRVRRRLQDLYASETKELSEYEKYRDSVSKANTAGAGEKQKGRLCTYASTATILKRKQALNGEEPTITRDYVVDVNPDMYWDRRYSANSTSYHVKTETSAVSSDRMVELLSQHPEGILVYDTGYPHAIVITDYEIEADGTIQFYADDPVNNAGSYGEPGRVKLEDTWFYKSGLKSSNPEAFFQTIDRICYVE